MKEKTYVFIIPSICNIGGAQLYLVNKINYLEQRGWTVNVVYARKDIIRVKELERFKDNCYPYLDYATMYYRKSAVKDYVNRISHLISNKAKGDIVIESCTISISTWAELIAARLKCKHICFAFEELFAMSESQLGFAYFKHKRHELAGITTQSVPLMFKNSKRYSIKNPEYYCARTIPIVSNIDNPYKKELNQYDCVIGSFGRLDKSFVWPALLEIAKYINNHKGKKYAVLLIGDSKDVRYKNKIRELFTNKADLIITGEMYPISRSLLKSVSAFVSSAGSATRTAIENIPTIAVSPATLWPNGILNYTTRDTILSDNSSTKSISELLEEIIDNGYCKSHSSLNMYDDYWNKQKESDDNEFCRQLEIAGDNSHGQSYYDVFSIKNGGIRKCVAMYGKVFGAKTFILTMTFLKKNIGTLVKG